MKYKNYLFDWDGSLGDTLPLWFENFKIVFAQFGIEITYQEIAEKVIGNWNGPAEFGVDNEDFFRKLEENVTTKLAMVKLNPGALELIDKIKMGGGKVGILTTSKRIWVEPAMKNLGILDRIDIFLGKEDVIKYKPDPEIILKAIEFLGGKKEETVMIGDTFNDVFAAKTAGVESVLYFPNRYTEFYDAQKQLKLGATRIIKDFGEIEV